MFGKIKQTLTGLAERPNLMAALSNLSWLAFDRVFRLGVSFVVTLWLARYLAPELFGVYNYAIAFTALFSVLATFGLQSVVVQYLIDKPDEQASTLASAFLIQFIGGLLAFIIAVVVAVILTPDDKTVLMAVVLLSTINLFKFSDTVRYYCESKVQSKRIVITENLVFLIIVLIRIGMILMESPLIHFIALLVLEAVLTTIAFLCMFGWQKFLMLRFEISSVIGLLRAAWPLMFSLAAALVYQRIDQLMLASMIGSEAVGIYSAAVRISEIWYVFPMIVVGSVFPRILKEIRLNQDRANRQIEVLLGVFFLISLLVALFIGEHSTAVIRWLFGSSYLEADAVLSIHIWSSIFVFSGAVASRWMLAMSLQKITLCATVLGAILNVILNSIFIPIYGPEGAAWSTLVSLGFSMVFFNFLHPATRRFFYFQIGAIFVLPHRISQWLRSS